MIEFPFRKGLKDLLIENLGKSSHKKDRQKFYASEPCPRRNVLAINSKEIGQWTPASELYTDIGEQLHKTITNALYRSGKSILFTEYKIPTNEINLGARIDAIILEDNQIKLLEIKSCGALPDTPNANHIRQLAIYAAYCGLSEGVLLYVSRNVLGKGRELLIETFQIEITDDMKKRAMIDVFQALVALEKNQVPLKPKDYTRKDCEYCPFFSGCWNEPHEGVDLIEEASQRAEIFLSETEKRQNGILEFLSKNGTPLAQQILKGSWDTLLTRNTK